MIRMTAKEARELLGEKKQSKYRNRKCQWKGLNFDSVLERDRFIILEDRQAKGEIMGLKRQVRYVLIPEQRIEGKVVERECAYVADFVYAENGHTVVEDTKSKATRTPEYIIKRKLMLFVHGLRIKEIGRQET